MKKTNWILDIIDIAIPLLIILFGGGNFGDYFTVYCWLFFSVLIFLIRLHKK